MNWELFSSIAEITGAAAVVISLVYLAAQVRQANVQAQGEAHANWLTTWNETIKGWITDRETVGIVQKGFSDFSNLPCEDQAIFAQHLAALINHWHLAADLVERGLLGDELYHGATEVILSVCATPGGRAYIDKSYQGFPRGLQLIEMVRSEAGSLPPWHEMAPWWSCDGAGNG